MPFREFRNLPGAELCYFQPGEYLIESGAPLRYIYYLQSGLVYREVVTASGNENFLSRRLDDDDADSIVGLLAMYTTTDDGLMHSGFVAQTECVCWRIPVEECKRYMRAHPELLERALVLAMQEFAQLNSRFMARREKNAAALLCNVLINYSRKAEDGRIILSKKIYERRDLEIRLCAQGDRGEHAARAQGAGLCRTDTGRPLAEEHTIVEGICDRTAVARLQEINRLITGVRSGTPVFL